jgi:hypothetical protein
MSDRNSEQRHNFFISYNRHDSHYAEWIAWILEEAGYSVFIQAWDFRAGENFVLKMQEAAAKADRTIAVLSQNFLDSRFTQPEWAAAFAQDPTGEKRLLILIRVGLCNIVGLLGQINYIDLVGLEEADAQAKILADLKKRGKPDKKPPFSKISGKPSPERLTSGRVTFPAVTIIGKQINIEQKGSNNTQTNNFSNF